MITSDDDLEIVRAQIGRLEAAVASLARDVRPKSERMFRLMAEGYEDQLDILRADVNRYLGVEDDRRGSHAVDAPSRDANEPGAGVDDGGHRPHQRIPKVG